MDATSQDVVFGNDLLDVEGVLDPLQTVGGRSTVAQDLSDGRLRGDAQRHGEFDEQIRNVIVECRKIEIARRRELPHFGPPPGQQGFAFAFDEPCQVVENVRGHSPSFFTRGIQLTALLQ